ncbi:hypothetical protein GYMLUDRAFT_56791 [Collybiopsis luxurians FD-317 M1]|nr:hypothetical protein GYMLUDRAFT_56791 [Collybiopsis luxurians FD-317 M1]
MHFTTCLAGLLSPFSQFFPQAVTILPNVVRAQTLNTIWVRSLAQEPIQALVSAFDTGFGDTDWFTLPNIFNDPDGVNPWHRVGWELIAFRDQNDPNSRVGYYYDFAASETWVTFTTFDNVTFSDFNPETDVVA